MMRGFLALSLLLGTWSCGGQASRDDGAGGDESCAPNTLVVASEQAASSTSNLAIDGSDAYWTFGIMVFDGPAEGIGSVTRAPLVGGAPTAVASEQRVPAAIALGATDVFWIDQFTAKIMKAPKTGGAPTELVASFNGNIMVLEADDDSVYYLDYDDGGPGVFKVPVGGGNAVRLATGQGQLDALALDATHVYWADHVETGGVRLVKVPIDGGEPTLLHAELYGNTLSVDLAVSPSGVYWNGDFATGLEPDGSVRIRLLRIPLAGGAPVVLAEESGISNIALNSNDVYWTVEPLGGLPGTIRKVPLNGGAVSSVASDQLGLSAIAADDTHVCWLNFANGIDAGEVVCRETCEDGS